MSEGTKKKGWKNIENKENLLAGFKRIQPPRLHLPESQKVCERVRVTFSNNSHGRTKGSKVGFVTSRLGATML